MQGGIEQRRVQSKAAGLKTVGEGHLREHLVVAFPDGLQPLEHRPVVESLSRQTVVHIGRVQLDGIARRPHREPFTRTPGPGVVRQHALRVPRPFGTHVVG
ncbi:hypothetical protein EES42_42575 [Streptomyces sp. ADI95-17]|nr:hypothetical protein EES42_42575 [Streptomyces sp. ADI95-17]